jgi:hypothetical protein
MKITLIITALAALMIVGCGKWEQDPLAGKSGVAAAGTQTPTVPVNPKPTPTDTIRVDTEKFHVFREDSPDTIKISARVLEPGYSVVLEIANLNSFPGASFNGKEFSWNPRAGTVTSADDQVKIMSLVVRATATKPGAQVLVRTEEISIQVMRTFKMPTIVSITPASVTVREGETGTANIVVEDTEANMAVPGTWPTLLFGASFGSSSIENLVGVDSIKSVGNNRYEVTVKIDLSSKPELTASKADFGYSVKAVSRFNVVGFPQSQSVVVLTSLTAPVTTWVKPVNAVVGEKFSHQFLIMDPKNEARLDRNVVFSGLPAGALAPVCQPSSDSVLSCVMNWEVPVTQTASQVSFTGTVKYGNTYAQDTAAKSAILSFSIAPSSSISGGQ